LALRAFSSFGLRRSRKALSAIFVQHSILVKNLFYFFQEILIIFRRI